MPESFWDAAKGEVKGEDFTKAFNDLTAFKAEADVRKNSLPADPSKYEVKLPSDFKAPEGLQFDIDQADPLWAQAREVAHQNGIGQEVFEKFAGLVAANKINELKATHDGVARETAKLGSAGSSRIDAVVAWLKAVGGPEMAIAADTLKAYPVAATVVGFENLIKKFSGQGGASFTQTGRAGDPPAGKIPGYENMSFEQKRMAQMNQPKAAGGIR